MKTYHVKLGARSYPIYIGRGLLGRKELMTPYIESRQVVVVTNETVAPLYLGRLTAALSDYAVYPVILPDGEQYKSLDILNTIFNTMLAVPCNRDVTVIALGGGVVGDIAGFAAACYQRGVAFIQIPTTLLAQVDSSVGGKTAVNHPLGKNMIGAFYQPRCVIADTDTLKTLDQRQLAAGIAEVIKYGLIRDPEFFTWLEQNMDGLLQRDENVLSYAIERSCQNKAEVVAEDELEGGMRATLNLGHTFGHAIETAMGYGEWLHGEAVATGMVMAMDLSVRLDKLSVTDLERGTCLIARAGLPIKAPSSLGTEQALELMQADKKVLAGKVRLVLLKSIGEAYVTNDYPRQLLIDTLEHCRES